MTLAERIKQIRENKGMTQKQAAALMGISQQAYSQYESGTREPKLETLWRIATALNVSKFELMRPVMEHDEDFVNSEWFAEMSDDDILDAMIPSTLHDEVKKEESGVTRQKRLLDSIDSDFYILNDEGQQEAAKRVQELTQIPKYQRKPVPQNVPTDADGKELAEK